MLLRAALAVAVIAAVALAGCAGEAPPVDEGETTVERFCWFKR